MAPGSLAELEFTLERMGESAEEEPKAGSTEKPPVVVTGSRSPNLWDRIFLAVKKVGKVLRLALIQSRLALLNLNLTPILQAK